MPCWPFSRKTTPETPLELSPPSKIEAKSYYAGLPSCPVLVARTSTTPWVPGTKKELHCVRIDHPIKKAWEDKELRARILTLLNSMEVKWSSIDVVCIGNAQEQQYSSADKSFFPVILWIGVAPASLSGHDGLDVASKCREFLVKQYHITDVDVEIRE
ncbi:hypothetical protein V8E54_003993, partial [Elaphomyces granulatus]